ncbi:hypothetical protein MN116_004610 [Schistosoma mekongi]|uniref:EGF-like domain-containing protein n=1 Tax=Schistosoma mekongi TaxID=38744 RepID=A0AAE1ZCP2_SCHME|nr:hypothetical protein MN116_004610 [Schistosoma mekongi]
MKLYLSVLLYCILDYLQMNGISCTNSKPDREKMELGSSSNLLTITGNGVSSANNSQHYKIHENKSCSLPARPESCSDILKTNHPITTHFGVLIEMMDEQMNPLNVRTFEGMSDSQRQQLASKSTTRISELVTPNTTSNIDTAHCPFVKFLPSDNGTVFVLHDVFYTSIRATQLNSVTLLETIKQNNVHLDKPIDFEKIHIKVYDNTIKRTCNECENICPPNSYCNNLMNGIGCTCRFGWVKVYGINGTEHCQLHQATISLITIFTMLIVILMCIFIYLLNKRHYTMKIK